MTSPKRDSPKKDPVTRKQAPRCKTDQMLEAARSERIYFATLREKLRMPVNAVIEYSELLLEDAREQGQDGLASDLMKIHSLGKKLCALVDVSLDDSALDVVKTEREMENFSSNLRHELRTPLNAIIGYSEMLLEDADAEGAETFIPDLEKIRQAGRSFLSCLEEITGFTPAISGDESVLAPVGTRAMVRRVINDIPPLDKETPDSTTVVRGSILVVDDNEISCDLMRRQLERQGHSVTTAGSGKQALDVLQGRAFDLVLLDIMMPDMSGYQVLLRLKGSNIYGDVPVIVVSALDDMDTVVQCLRMGAEDYLLKPFNHVLLKARIRTCLENKRLKDLSEALELRNLKEEVQLVAESRSMQQVLNTMRSVSRNPVNVLIQGESGTGKEVVARLIHQNSDRKAKPFVAVNCASIPENLMESEFFGYEKGAFTGAVVSRGGYFEEADGGTLFLDEIGDMPPAIQPKFLRVIQEGVGCRLGSAKPVRYDLRIVSASNKDLRQEVTAGRFRKDLYYRIFSVEIPIPPLRERREDIMPLTLFFMNKVGKRFNKKIAGPSPELLSLFEEYAWPGNVRQLLHEVEHMVALVPEGQQISLKYCSEDLRKGRKAKALALVESTRDLTLAERIEELEVTSIKEALRRTRGNKVQASKLLGITRQGLDKKIQRYKIAELSKSLYQ
jgi:DNA-binding NtrC family response regulator